MEHRPDLAATLQNLDTRLANVERILPTLATKDDLRGMHTAGDPKGFATREDLQAFAMKDDLQAFATKDDLKAFATKDDLKAFATKDDLKGFATKEDLAEGLERESKSLREFILENMTWLREEMAEDRRRFEAQARADRRAAREELLVLVEGERDRWQALLDRQGSVIEQLGRVDVESRARDRALDKRVSRLEQP